MNTFDWIEEWRGKQRISPKGIISPPWDNFTPEGQSLPVGAKLRMSLWMSIAKNAWKG
jgi:hypothetical protein